MRVSMVIPAFGNQTLLDASLETLRPQRRYLLEVIVVDDGSSPMLSVPDWVRLARIERFPKHRGSSCAKNYGASLARGDYLIFADSDILHMPSAIRSLKQAMQEWVDEGTPDVLLNTFRIGLPQGYKSDKVTRDWNRFIKAARGSLIDEEIWSLKFPKICYEQNCGMLSKALFERIGGYDERGFPGWGFNNQDLDLRVVQAGGRISSAIKCLYTKQRLLCFHIWHENNCDQKQAERDFVEKWGEPWTAALFRYTVSENETRQSERAAGIRDGSHA